MSKITTHSNTLFGELRTAEINGEPIFCLKDVCKSLGIENITNVKNRLNEDGVHSMEVIDSLGRKQMASFISESNLYKTIFMSRKPNAEVFTEWVTSEVLPSIRKTGGYINGQETMSDDELMAAALQVAQRKIAERDLQIAELAPKALFADCVTASEDTILIRDLAKMIQQNGVNIGGGRLWEWMRKSQP